MPSFKTVSTDGFEVVEVPATRVIPQVAEKATETELDKAQAQIDEIRRQVEHLKKKTGDKAVTHDRRVRTLEYCFDDREAEIQSISKAVEQVKKQIGGSAAKQEALDALRLSVGETKMLALSNSTRLDRMVVKSLPSIEAKFQGIKFDQEKQHEQTEVALRELAGKLDGISPSELTDIRRIAAEANLRARSVEHRLPELKAELFMALAVELASVQESSRKDRADASREADRLSKKHMDMWTDSYDLSLKVKGIEEVAQRLSSTVLPLLEHRLQQQMLLLSCKQAEIREVTNAAEARETLLKSRVRRLEEKLSRADIYALQNGEMQLRLATLERAIAHLSAGAKAPAVTKARLMMDKTDSVQRTIVDSIKAEVLRRAIQAELVKRVKRRQRMIAKQLSASAIRAGSLRIALSAEIRRRERRRIAPSAADIWAACIRRELRMEISRRKKALHRPSTPTTAVLRAACIRREIRVEIARREGVMRRRSVPSAAALRAACLRQELRREITRRQKELCLRTAPSEATIRAACIHRELRVMIAMRQEAVSRSRAVRITAFAIRAEILCRALVAEIARRKAVCSDAELVTATETANNGTVKVSCKTPNGEVFLNIEVPTFVSIRYLKQLIYFKGGCTMHPSTMNLVYAGRVLEDCWKVGGGLFTVLPRRPVRFEPGEFTGIQNGAIVLIGVKDIQAHAHRI